MKKLFVYGATLVAAMMFSACGDSSSNASDETNGVSSANDDANSSSSASKESEKICNVESGDDWVILEQQSDSLGYTWAKMTVKGDSIYYDEILHLKGEAPDTISFADYADHMTFEDILSGSEMTCKEFLKQSESSSSTGKSSSSNAYVDTSYYHYSSSSVILATCEYAEQEYKEDGARDPDSTTRSMVVVIPDSVTITNFGTLYGESNYLITKTRVFDKNVSKASIETICNNAKDSSDITGYQVECSDSSVTSWTTYTLSSVSIADIYFDNITGNWEDECEDMNETTRLEEACMFDIRDSVWEYADDYLGYRYIIRGDSVDIEELYSHAYDDSATCAQYVSLYSDGVCNDSVLTYTMFTDSYSIPVSYKDRVGLYESAHAQCVSDNRY